MPCTHRTLRTLARTSAVATGVVVTSCLLASPATAAPPSGGPNANASCVGLVFVPQATGAPRQVADQIHFLMEFVLPVEQATFGDAVSVLLARATVCGQAD